MPSFHRGGEQRFRLWIATYRDWSPSRWNEPPPRATAVEPVADALYTAEEAALFLEGFNSSMLESGQQIWGVAVPVVVRYEGDAARGERVRGYVFPPSFDAHATAADRAAASLLAPASDQSQGFDQSPHRSR